ncbi:MAG TPA: response regulator [Verrucomicrobiae bacterium]|jgi:CheY-like chemotaxis protein|nr:response regulator [Verrucomicrobiae bacterium]
MENQLALCGKRILLVDDERTFRETVRRLLCHDDHIVVEANNGAEALGLFAQDRFDLVLTDWEMPFVQGNELATQIRQLSPNQPILMITGYPRRPGRTNPVDAVLCKPFNLKHLRTAIAGLLQKSEETAVLAP